MVSEPTSLPMAKVTTKIEKLATQMEGLTAKVALVEGMSAKIDQIDELKVVMTQMMLQMQSVAAKLEAIPKTETPSVDLSSPEKKQTTIPVAPPIIPTFTLAHKEKKGELLPFSGENVDSWLLQAERFYLLNNIAEENRLDSVMLYLTGEALAWFIWTEKHQKITSWPIFRSKVDERWKSIDYDSNYEKLMDIKQDKSIIAYRTEFERLSSQIPELADPFLVRVYYKGLKPEIKAQLGHPRPTELIPLMEASLQMEKIIYTMWHTMKSLTPPDYSTFPSVSSTYLPRKTTPLLPASSTHYDRGKTPLATDLSTPNTMSRTLSLLNTSTHRPKRQLRLTDAEFHARREKGLCFHCEEKFQPGHKCKKQLNIFLVHDEDEDVLDNVESDWSLTRRNREVVDFTRYRIKNNTELTNLGN